MPGRGNEKSKIGIVDKKVRGYQLYAGDHGLFSYCGSFA
jgi:hypothetical protein